MSTSPFTMVERCHNDRNCFVTYLLEALRSLVSTGWEASDRGKAALAIAIMGTISMSMCFAALRGRVKRG